jgi:arginyl-tRNA synthetase
MDPLEIAYLIANEIEKNDFKKIEVAQPGYVNFHLSDEYLQRLVGKVNEEKGNFGSSELKKEKIMIEYSQPNTHKEFHIGHLRNVIIGSTLANVMEKSGYKTIPVNYIGDTGTHVAKCLWGLQKFYNLKDVEKSENKGEFLGKVYARSVQEIENHPEYEEEFRQVQKELEQGKRKITQLWKKTRKWSLESFSEIYKKLGVNFDAYFFESEEEKDGRKIVKELLKENFIRQSDGAIIADLEKYNLGVLVLVRNNGSILYGLKDIPLAIKKFKKYKIDESIVITDIRQEFYFKQIFKILELLGFKENMVHIGYEFVALKGGQTMASRMGNVISAQSVFDEMLKRVKEKYPNSPNPWAISLAAIKFSMLKYSAKTKIEFSIDESLSFEGATGPYVQYAYARVCSILQKAKKEAKISFKKTDLSQLNEEGELRLIREVFKFPEIISEISKDFQANRLAAYSISLADLFHSFYDSSRVIDPKNIAKSKARLALVNAVKIVLGESLRLMGIESPEKM